MARIMNSQCFYTILGVSRSSSDSMIRQAYKELALSFHPDKNDCDDALKVFQTIGQAYKVLSNKEQRSKYDEMTDPNSILASMDRSRWRDRQFQSNRRQFYQYYESILRLIFEKLTIHFITVNIYKSIHLILPGTPPLWN